jgi:hypothetical protein
MGRPFDAVALALNEAPAFPPPGAWTPLTQPDLVRHDAALAIIVAIRRNAFCLTAEERARLAIELLTPHSCDHAHDERFEPA